MRTRKAGAAPIYWGLLGERFRIVFTINALKAESGEIGLERQMLLPAVKDEYVDC